MADERDQKGKQEEKTDIKAESSWISASNIIILTLLLGIVVLVYIEIGSVYKPDGEGSMIAASALESRGLFKAALDEYDRYRSMTTMSRKEEAELLYKQGKLAEDKLNDWDRALAYYTVANVYFPEAGWSSDLGKRSVACMQKMGDSKRAQSLLVQLTDENEPVLPREIGDEQSPVVAVLDGRSVRWSEVESALSVEYQDHDTDDPEVRKKMVRSYVFVWMAAMEAKRSDIDSEPKVIVAMEQAQRSALAQAWMGREFKGTAKEDNLEELWNTLTKIHGARIFDGAISAP